MSGLLIKLAKWLESRRTVKFEAFQRIVAELRSEIQKPPADAKELMLMRARLDRLELYVGLKRDPTPQPVPGAARIQ
jgi:hypothetical protein